MRWLLGIQSQQGPQGIGRGLSVFKRVGQLHLGRGRGVTGMASQFGHQIGQLVAGALLDIIGRMGDLPGQYPAGQGRHRQAQAQRRQPERHQGWALAQQAPPHRTRHEPSGPPHARNGEPCRGDRLHDLCPRISQHIATQGHPGILVINLQPHQHGPNQCAADAPNHQLHRLG